MSKSKTRKNKQSTENQDQAGATQANMEAGVSLSELIRVMESYPNVWGTAPASIVPEKWLDSWWIIKVVDVPRYHEDYGFHFVGWNIREREGAVSSKIEKFDPVTMSGVTRSGRVYRLVGLPGFDPDADYVLSYWLTVNEAKVENATDEFIRQYGISLEHIEKLSQ